MPLRARPSARHTASAGRPVPIGAVAASLLLTMIALIVPAIAQAADAPPRPNIVLILADDLGYGHLGCYGQEKIRTPNIDRLAAEGIRFTQCYAGCTVCAPSRSVLMTGLHTGHTPVRANGGGCPLLPEDVTVAELLTEAGYTCGAFGKWGLGDLGTSGLPTRQGFAEFFGYLHQVHAHFYYPYYLIHNEEQFFLPENEGEKRVRYSHDEIAARGLDFLKRHHDRPLFLYLPFTLCHTELLVPEDSLAEYRGMWPETPHVSRGHYAPQETPRAALAAMITRLDRTVGEVMDAIKQLGIDDNTLVIFSSDNGGQAVDGPDLEFFRGNGPLRGAKGTLYEGGLRVPLVARWPGKIAPGTTSEQVVAFWDVMPTLAELAGAAVPAGIDGLSITPALIGPETAGRRQQSHDYLYWEHPARGGLMQAVRWGDYKGIRSSPDAPLELYDLGRDVGESTDIAPLHRDVAARIEAIMRHARTEPRDQSPGPRFDKSDYVR